MCGGEGTRLDRGEKPLVAIDGVPMIDRVLRALEASQLETVYAVPSEQTPETSRYLSGRVAVIETPGHGYVNDLTVALDRVDQPVFTVAGDLPLLAEDPIDRILENHTDGSLTVCIPTAIKRVLGVSIENQQHHEGIEMTPAGINIVHRDESAESIHLSYDARLAVNVNKPKDIAVAEVLANES